MCSYQLPTGYGLRTITYFEATLSCATIITFVKNFHWYINDGLSISITVQVVVHMTQN